jgi:glycosyltransferase involved in cell wall biosynthesis
LSIRLWGTGYCGHSVNAPTIGRMRRPTFVSSSEHPRVLLCFYEGYLGVAPSVVSAIRRFTELGYDVDVVLRRAQTYADPGQLPEGVDLLVMNQPSLRFSRVLRRRDLLGIAAKVFFSAVDAVQFIGRSAAAARRRRYHLVLGFDTLGFLGAALAARRARIPHLAYWSLELSSLGESRNPVTIIAKLLEKRLTSTVELSVVQDQNRAARLVETTNVSLQSIALIPNSPSGSPAASDPEFLHARLGLRSGTRVVLHAGMIGEELLSLELATAARTWTDPYLLVFHERERRSPDEPFLRQVSEAGGNRVVLSLDPVSLQDVDSVFASAFIGLALYSDIHGANVADIGTASGKLAFCLRNGVPVIASALPGLAEFIEGTGCGVVVRTPADVWGAMLRISEDYDGFRSRAFKAFEERLNFQSAFDSAFGHLLEHGSSVAGGTTGPG